MPAEGYGGWQREDVEIARQHTALVVMHAWETGMRGEYPGWHRAVEYMPRAQVIAETVFPSLLTVVRSSEMPVFHVVGGGGYYGEYEGYQHAVELAGQPVPQAEQISVDPELERLRQLRRENFFVGKHNEADVQRGFAQLDFIAPARPVGEEGVAENAEQLFALCKEIALWRVALAFGFVFDVEELVSALRGG